MADISAKDVAALRKITGAGMMDCKRALEESEGDMEKAKTWLREKGLAAAGKRAGRAASQGTVDVYVEGNIGAVVELTAETDFVAKGDGFNPRSPPGEAVAEQGEDIASKPDAGDTLPGGRPYSEEHGRSLGENRPRPDRPLRGAAAASSRGYQAHPAGAGHDRCAGRDGRRRPGSPKASRSGINRTSTSPRPLPAGSDATTSGRRDRIREASSRT